MLDEFERHALRQADDRRLGGAIDRDVRLAAPAGLAGEVDDLAALAGGDHPGGNDLRGEQQAADIDVELPVEVRLGDLGQRRHVEYRGAVDQDVDWPDLVATNSCRHGFDRLALADVDGDRDGCRRRSRRAVCLRLVDQQVGDDDTRTFFDVALGDCAADAAGAAGDDGDLVLQASSNSSLQRH